MMDLDEHRDIDDDVNPITGDLDVEFSTSDVNLTSLHRSKHRKKRHIPDLDSSNENLNDDNQDEKYDSIDDANKENSNDVEKDQQASENDDAIINCSWEVIQKSPPRRKVLQNSRYVSPNK